MTTSIYTSRITHPLPVYFSLFLTNCTHRASGHTTTGAIMALSRVSQGYTGNMRNHNKRKQLRLLTQNRYIQTQCTHRGTYCRYSSCVHAIHFNVFLSNHSSTDCTHWLIYFFYGIEAYWETIVRIHYQKINLKRKERKKTIKTWLYVWRKKRGDRQMYVSTW